KLVIINVPNNETFAAGNLASISHYNITKMHFGNNTLFFLIHTFQALPICHTIPMHLLAQITANFFMMLLLILWFTEHLILYPLAWIMTSFAVLWDRYCHSRFCCQQYLLAFGYFAAKIVLIITIEFSTTYLSAISMDYWLSGKSDLRGVLSKIAVLIHYIFQHYI
ncbi:hypothetical protein ACJX0J_030655, partial [Zea mays]